MVGGGGGLRAILWCAATRVQKKQKKKKNVHSQAFINFWEKEQKEEILKMVEVRWKYRSNLGTKKQKR